VQEEKDFIEATSRITSFNVLSRPGIPISPLEIRLTKDRLSLVARVLSATSDAYKHPEVILDLVRKLGLDADAAAHAKALAMLADTALQSEDFARAHDAVRMLVDATQRAPADTDEAAREVCWVACFQLGRQPEYTDAPRKLALLGRALALCPAERLGDILAVWRRLEADVLAQRGSQDGLGDGLASGRRRRVAAGARSKKAAVTPYARGASLAARFSRSLAQNAPASPDPASIAHTFSRVAGALPFGMGIGGRPRSVASVASDDSGNAHGSERAGTWSSLDHASEEVGAQASRALQKGLGWLIGADDE
jgi:hypothetical protein